MAAYVEMPLRFFLANGMAPQDAARLLEVLFALGFGHAMLTTNYNEMRGHGVPPVRFTEASYLRTVRLLIDGYSAGRFRRPDRRPRDKTAPSGKRTAK